MKLPPIRFGRHQLKGFHLIKRRKWDKLDRSFYNMMGHYITRYNMSRKKLKLFQKKFGSSQIDGENINVHFTKSFKIFMSFDDIKKNKKDIDKNINFNHIQKNIFSEG